MAEVKLRISAEDKASTVLEKMVQSGQNASDRLQGAFDKLGIKSTEAFDRQRESARVAYDQLKSSGVATADELVRAEKALGERLVAIDGEQFGRRASLLQKFKSNWLAVVASVGAAWVAAQQAWNMAESGAKGVQQRQSFGNLAASRGLNSQAILDELRQVSAGTVATQQLVEKAGTAMLLGIDGKVLPKLMEIARASSRITGETIGKNFDDLALAVGRQSKMILDNLGIMVDVEKANVAYAKTIGKTALTLNDAEKKQAFMNATLAAGQKIIDDVGVSGLTAMEKMQRVGATMENLKEVAGRGVLAAFMAVQGIFYGVASASLLLSAGLFKVISAMSAMVGATKVAADFQISAEAALQAALELGQQANDSLSSSWDIASGKIDQVNQKLAAHQKALTDAKAAAAAKEEADKLASESAAAAASALDRYSKVVADLGREQLKIAESGFTRDLERQEEFYRKTGSVAGNLAAPIRAYLAVLDQVYGSQLKAQKEISETLKNIGAPAASVLQRQIAVATTEKTYAEQRLKGWNDYYAKLQTMHSAAMDTMKAKQEAALAVRKSGESFGKELASKYADPTQGASAYDQFFIDLQRADADATAAMQMTGPQKTEALSAAMNLLKELPREVKDGDQVILSSADIYDKLVGRFTALQDARQALADSEATASKDAADKIATEMARAQEAMQTVQNQIIDLDARILALNKTVALTLSDQASAPIARVRSALDALKDKELTITVSYVSNIPGSVASAPPGLGGTSVNTPFGADFFSNPASAPAPPIPVGTPEFALGTDYVPRTGLALIHKGERIIPAEQNKPGAIAGNTNINFGGLQLVLPNVTNQSSGRDLAREALPEIMRLMKLSGGGR